MFISVRLILKKIIPLLLIVGLISGSPAAENTKPTPAPTVIPRALPVEKSKEKSPGFIQRLFKKKPTPAPTPEPTPPPKAKPIAKKRPKNTNRPQATATPDLTDPANPNPGLVPLPDSPPIESTNASPDSTPLPTSLPPLVGDSIDNSDTEIPTPAPLDEPPPAQVAATPPPPEIRNNPMNQPIALVDDAPPLVITPDPATSPEANLEKETVERIQFRKLKAKALEDSKLQALKQKSELAATPTERYTALKEYYPRLFASMRKIDETFSVQIDEMEAASRRRLERMEAEELPASGNSSTR